MKTIGKKLYEAMFLVDSLVAATDWDSITGLIGNILQRADAEIVSLKKWDDRKLTYEIAGKSRATYILCYFKAFGPKVTQIEHDVQLSDRIMRVLILSAEPMSQEDIDRPTPAELAEKPSQAPVAVEAAPAEVEAVPAAELEEIPETETEDIDVEKALEQTEDEKQS